MKYFQNNFLPYDGEVYYFPAFYKLANSKDYFQQIQSTSKFRQDKITMFGKTMEQPRLVAWHGDQGVKYIYSKIELIAPGWTPVLEKIKKDLKQKFSLDFNSVLVNLYRDGEDYMSYHADNEKELGPAPIIASVSFGASRDFLFKHNVTKEVVTIPLGEGDLLIIKGKTQDFWKHSLPKRKKVNASRINLTFRLIKR